MKVYVHLGIHKTGSSFLQKEFFPRYQRNICFLNRAELRYFKAYILNTDDFDFDSDEALKLFNKALGDRINSEKVIISDEEFYGNPYMGSIDRKRNFDRLHEIFGNDLSCIVFLRNQQDLLNSLYNQYVKTGGIASFKDFINYKKYPLNFNFSYLVYDKYIAYLNNVLGGGRIKVYLYEDFLRNKLKVLNDLNYFFTKSHKDLSAFVDTNRKVNSSLKNGNIPLLRIINKFTRSPKEPFLLLHLNFHKLFRRAFLKLNFNLSTNRKYILTSPVDIKVINDSNIRLSGVCKEIDLVKFGYLMETN